MKFTATDMKAWIDDDILNIDVSLIAESPIKIISVPITITEKIMEKDYSLLRPFDLEAAKRGEKICTMYGNEAHFVGVRYNGRIVIESSDEIYFYLEGMLRSSPLAWVEGRPVYRGDVLYFNSEGSAIFGPVVIESEKNEMILVTFKDKFRCNLDVSKLTLQKPKTKRDGWMNCYKEGLNYVYPNEEAANNYAGIDRIQCVRIEWEE